MDMNAILAAVKQVHFHPEGFLAAFQFVSAFLVAFAFLAYKMKRHRHRFRVAVILRAMFRKSYWLNRGTFVDCCYVLGNATLLGGLVIAASLASEQVYHWLLQHFIAWGGAPQPTGMSSGMSTAVMMTAAFLGYELGYFIYHYLGHKVRFLWEFHKVHHSANNLTPFTNYRVHPVDRIVFYNIIALAIGLLQAVVGYVLGTPPEAIGFSQNFFLLAYFYLYGHLQHTHLWIPFTGWVGHVFCSPAHHQIHHSTKPRHFDKNFGSSLVLFDWLFGTLYMPSKEREVTTVGVNDDAHLKGFISSLFMPCLLALRHLLPRNRA